MGQTGDGTCSRKFSPSGGSRNVERVIIKVVLKSKSRGANEEKTVILISFPPQSFITTVSSGKRGVRYPSDQPA